jgi:aryl-alcohol dehydrogenase-like predicted oxidoreductase
VKYRTLGNTGLTVSEVALGTVELGLDYGFKESDHYHRPAPDESIRLIHRAIDLGINLIDTARAYGDSEYLVGRTLAGLSERPYIASKVYLPDDVYACDPRTLGRVIVESVETSLKQLRIEAIDIIQIHNTKAEILQCEEVFAVLEELKRKGLVRLIGASSSTRGEEVPLEIIRNGRIPVLQVPFNLLDQVPTRRVFPEAAKNGTGILVRSAFLRGVLTNQVHSIPERLAPLKEAALAALRLLGTEVGSLSEAALRFCLSFTAVSSVIVGVSSITELEENLAAAGNGPLSPEALVGLGGIVIEDEKLVDTTQWQDLTS